MLPLDPSWQRDSNIFTANFAGTITQLKIVLEKLTTKANYICKLFVIIIFHFRCEEKPVDLPKKATLPSIQTDTMSISDEDFNTGARYLFNFLSNQIPKSKIPNLKFKHVLTDFNKSGVILV